MQIKVQNKPAVLTNLLNRAHIAVFYKVRLRKINNDISNIKQLVTVSVDAAAFEFNNCIYNTKLLAAALLLKKTLLKSTIWTCRNKLKVI